MRTRAYADHTHLRFSGVAYRIPTAYPLAAFALHMVVANFFFNHVFLLQGLAELLRKSKTLVQLDLSRNLIKSTGGVALGSALAANVATALSTLRLKSNTVKDEGAAAFATALASEHTALYVVASCGTIPVHTRATCATCAYMYTCVWVCAEGCILQCGTHAHSYTHTPNPQTPLCTLTRCAALR